MTQLFNLHDIRVAYDSADVLTDIGFHINAGEFVGIVGPNGSGKSTLLKAMVGALRPASGAVSLNGRDVSSIRGRDLARMVAVVPQDSPVAFEFTVLEVVLMGRAPHLGRFELEKRSDLDFAADALKRTNLLQHTDRRIGELSGGERQRAIIARALAQQTDILLLDEPTAHLDLSYQVEILDLLSRENAAHGKTVIVVLHDLNLAAEFCGRLLMIKDGRLYADGPPEEVITAENVRRVYGTSVWVRKHPTSGRPYILSTGSRAVSARFADSGDHPRLKAHVICGGGSGLPVFTFLLESGCEVTAGVINIGDSDQEAAESLGIEYVEDAPFSPVSEAAESANWNFISSADVIVVAEVPFGSGNVSNLRAVVRAMEQGKRVAVIGKPESYAERDFMDGEVERLLRGLVEGGAAALQTPEAIPEWVAKTG